MVSNENPTNSLDKTEKKQPNLIINYIYNVVYELFIIIIPFITATYTSRVFQADGIGIYSFTSNCASYAVLIGSLGTAAYGQREIARHRNNPDLKTKTFYELFILRIITTSICLAFYLIPSFLSSRYGVYLQALTITIIAGMFDISWFYRGIEHFKVVTLFQILVKTLSIICLFLFIKQKGDLIWYLVLISLSTLLGNLLMWCTLFKHIKKVKISELKPLPHLKKTFVYFIPAVATSIYTQLDKLMIGWITKDDCENGYYEQTTKIIAMLKGLVLTINIVMSSRMSFLFEYKKFEEMKKRLVRTCDFIMLLAIPAVVGLVCISDSFVPIFFGNGYDKVVILLYIMSPILIVVGLSNVLGACYFTPSGQRSRSNKVIVLGALINVVLNIPLILAFKSIGACIASVIAETFIATCYLFMGKEWLKFKSVTNICWKKIIASIFMICVVIGIKSHLSNSIASLLLEVFFGAITYGIIEVVLGDNVVRDIIKRILSILTRKKQ